MFGPGSEFGFENLLRFFGLPVTCSEADSTQVWHTLGFGYPALPCQKNPLFFFHLPSGFSPFPTPHKMPSMLIVVMSISHPRLRSYRLNPVWKTPPGQRLGLSLIHI